MEYIADIQTLRNMLLVLINVGVIYRVIVCAIKAAASYDENGIYFKRIKSALIFGVMANLIVVFKDVILSYFPGAF